MTDKTNDSEIAAGWPIITGFDIIQQTKTSAIAAAYMAVSKESGKLHLVTVCVCPESSVASNDADRLEKALLRQKQLETHNSIQSLMEVRRASGYIYAISEAVNGPTIAQLLAEDGALSLERTVQAAADIAAVIDFIAARGSGGHGGIEPDTVLFDPAENRFVVGYYLYYQLVAQTVSAWCSPETVNGAPSSPTSDMYSLGALIYTCRSARPPFSAATAEGLAVDIKRYRVPDLLQDPMYVQQVVRALCSHSPRDRYRVAVDAIDDLKSKRGPEIEFSDGPPPCPVLEFDSSLHAEFPDVVLPGEPGFVDPYGDSINKHRPRWLLALLEFPGALLGSVAEFISSPFGAGRRSAATNEAAYRRPRVQSGLEIAIRSLVGTVWRISWRLALVSVPVILAHSAYSVYQQHSVIIGSVRGKLLIKQQNSTKSIATGEKLQIDSPTVFETSKDSSATLSLPSGSVHLEPSTIVAIRRLELDGRDRVFIAELKSGQAAASVSELYTPQARFEFTCASVRIRARSSRFRITATDSSDGALVQAETGTVAVMAGDSRKNIDGGQQVRATDDGIGDAGAIPEKSLNAIHEQAGGAVSPQIWTEPVHQYLAWEERTVIPKINKIFEAFRMKRVSRTPMQDAKALSSAKIALSGLSTLLKAEGDPPTHLDLLTLAPTGLDEKEAQTILNAFEGKRLVGFYRLRGDAFEVFGRANDSNHTLLRLNGGVVTSIKEEDEGPTLAAAKKRVKELEE